MQKKILVCTGGTGGHVFCAYALCEMFHENKNKDIDLLNYDINIDLLVDERGGKYLKNYSFISLHNIKKPPICGIKKDFLKAVFDLQNFVCLFNVFRNVFIISKLFLTNRYDYVIGFGGVATITPIVMAKIFKLFFKTKIIVHEQNIILGKSNRFLLNFADYLTYGFFKIKDYSFNTKDCLKQSGLNNNVGKCDFNNHVKNIDIKNSSAESENVKNIDIKNENAQKNNNDIIIDKDIFSLNDSHNGSSDNIMMQKIVFNGIFNQKRILQKRFIHNPIRKDFYPMKWDKQITKNNATVDIFISNTVKFTNKIVNKITGAFDQIVDSVKGINNMSEHVIENTLISKSLQSQSDALKTQDLGSFQFNVDSQDKDSQQQYIDSQKSCVQSQISDSQHVNIDSNLHVNLQESQNPVLSDISSQPQTAFKQKNQINIDRTYLQESDDFFNIIIFAGSQGADFFYKQIPHIFNGVKTNKKIKILQQVSLRFQEDIKKLYQSFNIECELREFIENMPLELQRADMAITRSGALTVFELLACACPAIVVPYPYAADNHQLSNAFFLEKRGCVNIFCEDQDNDQSIILSLNKMINDDIYLLKMSTAMRELNATNDNCTFINFILFG